jgi:hypothetical protein
MGQSEGQGKNSDSRWRIHQADFSTALTLFAKTVGFGLTYLSATWSKNDRRPGPCSAHASGMSQWAEATSEGARTASRLTLRSVTAGASRLVEKRQV